MGSLTVPLGQCVHVCIVVVVWENMDICFSLNILKQTSMYLFIQGVCGGVVVVLVFFFFLGNYKH